ncbi:hypothetical protein POPTART_69 [Mycobacterium phage PopTart]|uniref:Uncharacterized protein n=1 Tax=Mycobacterium phage PopTart TaxID=1698712 RepID=A0A0K2FNY6_9CAUD|nr:hypothetical protein POPTART_69 [Mycobacterium phage PopTart]ALA48615.1 hypothetical protein POPTART_69 [Mycobacterium phage PopTart]AQY55576.1 hypothetical protein PBI_SassyB_69 [Mycobacterium phage SassyB]
MNTPELRAVLTEALSEALNRLWTDPEDAADQADWDALPGKLADVIVSLPGVAVIQLPEPTHSGTVSTSFRRATAWSRIPQARGESRLITLDDPGRCMSATEARTLAADLIAAAAVVAEEEDNHG